MKKTVLLLFLLLLTSVSTLDNDKTEEFINKYHKDDVIVFDVDAGGDDALALLMALKAEALGIGPPVIGVTCVTGNTELKNVVVNVQRTLQVARRQDVPVYVGSKSGLVFDMPSGIAFGKDGFGDIPYDPKLLVAPQSKHAVNALIELVNKYSGRIVIFAIGPLTNIALAEKMHPGLLTKVKSLVIMGGSSRGVGNIKPGVEFNIHMDPEAFHIVLNKTNYKRAMAMPWDPVVAAGIPKEWWENEFATIDNSWPKFIVQIAHKYVKTHPMLFLADAVAYLAYLRPSMKEEYEPLRVVAVTDGTARGAFLIDYYHADRDVESSNLEVIQKFSSEKFQEFLLWLFSQD